MKNKRQVWIKVKIRNMKSIVSGNRVRSNVVDCPIDTSCVDKVSDEHGATSTLETEVFPALLSSTDDQRERIKYSDNPDINDFM